MPHLFNHDVAAHNPSFAREVNELFHTAPISAIVRVLPQIAKSSISPKNAPLLKHWA